MNSILCWSTYMHKIVTAGVNVVFEYCNKDEVKYYNSECLDLYVAILSSLQSIIHEGIPP